MPTTWGNDHSRWGLLLPILLLFSGPGRGETTTACCRSDGNCQDVSVAACEGLGGVPFGPCSSCAQVSIWCPPAACMASTESCAVPHAEPGCEDLSCCRQICSFMPSCCTEAWTPACASQSCFESPAFADGCLPDGSCQSFPLGSECYDAGCFPSSIYPGTGNFQCSGDADGDAIDDACGCPPAPPPHPLPIPSTLTVGKNPANRDLIDVAYDAVTCSASEYMLFFGAPGNFSQVVTAQCQIGNDGSHTTTPPEGDVWFLVAGREANRYSSVGHASAGERVLSGVEEHCGAALAPDTSADCP